MPLYEIRADSIEPIGMTTFGAAGLFERQDLQRLLRDRIDVVAPDVMVIAEEFGEWTDSRRRIDLLGVDKAANLVVIELKRTEDGGHMELQSVRYAAMVSTLTAERAVELLEQYLEQRGREDEDAEQALLEFLEWDELDEEKFGQDVRIVLVSADFSREVTTTVLWLNEKDLDIRCVRLRPYEYGGNTLLDVQQVIPLPETANYQVQVREKKRQERMSRTSGMDFTRYDITIGGTTYPAQWKRNAILLVVKALYENGVSPQEIGQSFRQWGRGNAFLSVEGETRDVEVFAEKAQEALGAQGRTYTEKRWHTAPGDLMPSGGRTYVLTNQWGKHWPQFMKSLKEEFPQLHLEYSPTGKGEES